MRTSCRSASRASAVARAASIVLRIPPKTSISQLASTARLYDCVTPPMPASLPVPVPRADPARVGRWQQLRPRAIASSPALHGLGTSPCAHRDCLSTARRTSAVSCSSPKVSHQRDRLSTSAAGCVTGADHAAGAFGTGGSYGRRTLQPRRRSLRSQHQSVSAAIASCHS